MMASYSGLVVGDSITNFLLSLSSRVVHCSYQWSVFDLVSCVLSGHSTGGWKVSSSLSKLLSSYFSSSHS